MKLQHLVFSAAIALGIASAAGSAVADGNSACSGLPSQAALQTALDAAVSAGGNGGLGFNMWGTLVAKDGTVCAVAFSGSQFTDQWLTSRVISAQKANTANGLSLGEGSDMPASSHSPTAWRCLRQICIRPRSPAAAFMVCSTVIRWTPRSPIPGTRRCSAPP